MQVTINIPGSPLEAAAKKMAIEKIATNFNQENIQQIAQLSGIPDANNKLKTLFNNPLFKMATK